jgi:hypothetical protein
MIDMLLTGDIVDQLIQILAVLLAFLLFHIRSKYAEALERTKLEEGLYSISEIANGVFKYNEMRTKHMEDGDLSDDEKIELYDQIEPMILILYNYTNKLERMNRLYENTDSWRKILK